MNHNGSFFWNETSACAIGVQIRKATCMKLNSGPVVNKRQAFVLRVLLRAYLQACTPPAVFSIVVNFLCEYRSYISQTKQLDLGR